MDAVRAEVQEEIPARTALAPLQPHGLGTSYVESLSSYFQRLGDQHSVSPKLIAREFVLPRLGFNNRVGEVQSDRYWRSSFFNGMGEVPEQWCKALGELTGVKDLRRLTLLPLHGLVGMHGSSSAVHRWCPRCLYESEVEDHPYGQLLWEIGCVKACPRHEIQLISAHGCGTEEAVSPLRTKPLPHLCRVCGRSLALASSTGLQPAEEAEVSFARAIGELLASHLFAAGPREPGRTIADFLSEVIRSHEGGHGIRAVRRIGATKGEVSEWMHGRHLPSLPQATMVASAYGVPLAEVLVGRGSDRLHPNPWARDSRRGAFTPYKRWGMHEDMEAQLQQFLRLSIPPTEAEAAGMLGTSSRELRRLYPEQCRAIGARRVHWAEQEAIRRRDERLRVVEELVNQMVCEGVLPTIARLEERLVGIPKSFLFKERTVCKQICVAGNRKLGA